MLSNLKNKNFAYK